jgi:outer membrane protein OmpA-like peptidoglycan-associated protein
VALRIHFDPSKATIKPDSQPVLEQVAELMRTQADLRLSVEGHTDNTGTAQANKLLSQRRADSVVAALVQKGVARARLVAVGWGQERPVADNRSDAGREKNRRIELVKK